MWSLAINLSRGRFSTKNDKIVTVLLPPPPRPQHASSSSRATPPPLAPPTAPAAPRAPPPPPTTRSHTNHRRSSSPSLPLPIRVLPGSAASPSRRPNHHLRRFADLPRPSLQPPTMGFHLETLEPEIPKVCRLNHHPGRRRPRRRPLPPPPALGSTREREGRGSGRYSRGRRRADAEEWVDRERIKMWR